MILSPPSDMLEPSESALIDLASDPPFDPLRWRGKCWPEPVPPDLQEGLDAILSIPPRQKVKEEEEEGEQ
jgi:hypothetical protein